MVDSPNRIILHYEEDASQIVLCDVTRPYMMGPVTHRWNKSPWSCDDYWVGYIFRFALGRACAQPHILTHFPFNLT